jgi:hypothetical protein
MQPPELRLQLGPTEAAFFHLESEGQWHVWITWKCPVCGRRKRVKKDGLGSLQENLPILVECKYGHDAAVIPYRTAEKV